MKKLLSILLVTALVLTMAFMMTACGEKEPADDDEDAGYVDGGNEEGGEEEGENLFPTALRDLPALALPELANTGWTFAGGMVDGVEMDQAQADATLAACGGIFQIVFDGETPYLVNGNGATEGVCDLVTEDGLHMVFGEIEYYAVFTQAGDVTVMMLANFSAEETAMYMTMIDEH